MYASHRPRVASRRAASPRLASRHSKLGPWERGGSRRERRQSVLNCLSTRRPLRTRAPASTATPRAPWFLSIGSPPASPRVVRSFSFPSQPSPPSTDRPADIAGTDAVIRATGQERSSLTLSDKREGEREREERREIYRKLVHYSGLFLRDYRVFFFRSKIFEKVKSLQQYALRDDNPLRSFTPPLMSLREKR